MQSARVITVSSRPVDGLRTAVIVADTRRSDYHGLQCRGAPGVTAMPEPGTQPVGAPPPAVYDCMDGAAMVQRPSVPGGAVQVCRGSLAALFAPRPMHGLIARVMSHRRGAGHYPGAHVTAGVGTCWVLPACKAALVTAGLRITRATPHAKPRGCIDKVSRAWRRRMHARCRAAYRRCLVQA